MVEIGHTNLPIEGEISLKIDASGLKINVLYNFNKKK